MSALDSYYYKEFETNKVGEDEKGEYKIVNVCEELPCDCHPETCCHFDEKETHRYEKKIYIENK